MSGTITSIPGVRVGHWSDNEAMTGCTVVVLPEPNVVAGEVRGGAPATREYALLQPGMSVQQAQAILLTGGSAFGLAAADGVMAGLEADGRGHETGVGVRVPIVPAAVIFDLVPGDPSVRPGPEQGRAAYEAANDDEVVPGLVGAGTGATAAKWRGFEHMRPGGLGSALADAGDARVGALVVLNPVGDVFSVSGESLTGGDPVAGPPNLVPSDLTNTTLVVLATDAALTRVELNRLIVRAHDALAACLRPVHTRYDGDVVFAVSVGAVDEDKATVAEGAFAATAEAIENAVRATNP
ncbi:MAG TPA: P1 family peptidase [Acidimicrobiia bacterium]|nr:P1 family peptidase [Acidimicrobiia bacterium]